MTSEKVYVAASPIHGGGVFAAVDIGKGERIFAIDDSNVMPKGASLEEVERQHKHHTDYLAGGKVVILKAPEGCVNHSCDPNAYEKTVEGERYSFALRDVHSGEEITYDSRINGGGDTVWECNCGSERCRHTIHSDFFHLPLELQVEYLPLLDDWFVEENQLLVEALRREATQNSS